MLRIHSIVTTGLFALTLGVIGATGCSSSGGASNCESPKCSADEKPTAAQIAGCKEKYKDADCAAGLDCIASKVKCGADNKTDGVATITELAKDSGCAQKYATAIQKQCQNFASASPPGDAGK